MSEQTLLEDVGLRRRNPRTNRDECTSFGWFIITLGVIAGIIGLILASILMSNWNSAKLQNVLALNITNGTIVSSNSSCVVCPVGPAGPAGTNGTNGVNGTSGGALGFAHFYALMPGDNTGTIAVDAPVNFPQNGATSVGLDTPTRLSANTFNLPTIGTYEIFFQVSIAEAGQLVLTINGVPIPFSVAGRATGSSQISNNVLVTTTLTNRVLEVRNAPGNPAALTITPIAGGTNPVSATLLIKKLI